MRNLLLTSLSTVFTALALSATSPSRQHSVHSVTKSRSTWPFETDNKPVGISDALFAVLNGSSTFTGSQDEALTFVTKELGPIPPFIGNYDTFNSVRYRVESITPMLIESFINPENFTFGGTRFAGLTYSILRDFISAADEEMSRVSDANSVRDLAQKLGMHTESARQIRWLSPFLGFLVRMAQLSTQEARKEKSVGEMVKVWTQTFFIRGSIAMAITGETKTPDDIFKLCEYLVNGIFCLTKPRGAHRDVASQRAIEQETADSIEYREHHNRQSHSYQPHGTTFRNTEEQEEQWFERNVPLFGIPSLALGLVEAKIKDLPANKRLAAIMESSLMMTWALGVAFNTLRIHSDGSCELLGLGKRCGEFVERLFAADKREELK
jgi:hypothetical protein